MAVDEGYEVIVDEIEKAARIADAAGDYVGGTDLTGALEEVNTALPGSTSACKAEMLANSLHDDVTKWRDDVVGHARKLGHSAQLYRSNEDATQQNLRNSNLGIEAR